MAGRWRATALVLAGLAAPLAALAEPAQATGLFARHAVGVANIYGGPRPKTLTAPDGRTRAIARFSDWTPDDDSKDHLSVFVGGDDHDFPDGVNTELLWAPDSRALAVTADVGDDPSRYETTILVRKPKGRHWREIAVTRKVAKLFAPRMRCEDDEKPNVGAVGWTSAQRLIVAAQVPRHSSCLGRGTFAAYVVDVPSGEVLMELSARDMQGRYRSMLGTALAAGPLRAGHRHRRGR